MLIFGCQMLDIDDYGRKSRLHFVSSGFYPDQILLDNAQLHRYISAGGIRIRANLMCLVR